MWQYNNTDELYHYGVLGMKWHVNKVNKALNEYKKSINSDKVYDKYDKYKKVVDNEIKSLKKNNMKLLYDFNKDKYYAIKNKKNVKKWSMKKKILVGASVTAGIIGGVIGTKKLKNYINRQNNNVAEHFASKIMIENGWNKKSLQKASEVRKMVNNQPMKYKIKNVMKYKFNKGYPYK